MFSSSAGATHIELQSILDADGGPNERRRKKKFKCLNMVLFLTVMTPMYYNLFDFKMATHRLKEAYLKAV